MSDENLDEQPSEDAHEQDPDHLGEAAAEDEREGQQQTQARLDAALRRYRATLRNEAETGNEGFSADYYKSQKPPHW
ncbi:hypothetical protein [Brevibacterium marinum]|uniref:Uncharacterized protein n=1 Tax=Brevibacterium marinum TaxID=418643 RepID=A0A846S427_9MICO|nr:hypothetical protein [Brevibacterium marinum]NJC56262.1 hypothetical protein [Brevibacterium marinum]